MPVERGVSVFWCGGVLSDVVGRNSVERIIGITDCAPPHACPLPGTYTLTHVRDGETAYVSLNDQTCWRKTGITTEEGTQQCGHFQPKNEKNYPVFGCSVKLRGSGDKPLKIRVWTDLDEPLPDESFGIDNLVIERVEDTTTAPSACLLNYLQYRVYVFGPIHI